MSAFILVSIRVFETVAFKILNIFMYIYETAVAGKEIVIEEQLFFFLK